MPWMETSTSHPSLPLALTLTQQPVNTRTRSLMTINALSTTVSRILSLDTARGKRSRRTLRPRTSKSCLLASTWTQRQRKLAMQVTPSSRIWLMRTSRSRTCLSQPWSLRWHRLIGAVISLLGYSKERRKLEHNLSLWAVSIHSSRDRLKCPAYLSPRQRDSAQMALEINTRLSARRNSTGRVQHLWSEKGVFLVSIWLR